MEIDPNQLKQILKEAVLEALSEYEAGKGAAKKPSSEGEQKPKAEVLSYEEVFHRIMSRVARNEIDEVTAGELIAEARVAFDQKGNPTTEQHVHQPNVPDFILQKLAAWEQEIQGYQGQAAETTLEMMERMRERLEKEAQEADFHKASQQLDKEIAQQKAASDLQAIKDRLSKEK